MVAQSLDEPLPALAGRLGYLLKHAQLRLADMTGAALRALGIDGRECAVLIAIDEQAPLSQQEVADRMGVDRTTMVALIDELETKDLVTRQPDPADRRRNVTTLTASGRKTLRRAVTATEKAERRALDSMSDAEITQFKQSLRRLAFPPKH
jgi:DNA-binding MarR family transcriptional regulator